MKWLVSAVVIYFIVRTIHRHWKGLALLTLIPMIHNVHLSF